MAKLIDKIKVGMSMEQVRKIIPFKPFLIIPEIPMSQKTGHTKWIYLNSKGSLEISFQDSIYQSHTITPTLDEMERMKAKEEKEI